MRKILWLCGISCLVWGCAVGSPPRDDAIADSPAQAVQAALAPVGARGPSDLDVQIEFPVEGTIFSEEPEAYMAGRMLAPFDAFRRVDAILVIDTSASTADSSGADVDQDGITSGGGPGGQRDEGDSILAAEVASARELLDDVDPRGTRLGVVSFSGFEPKKRDELPGVRHYQAHKSARTEAPLTHNLEAVDQALGRILASGSEGMTHMAAALDRAVVELSGGRGALSTHDLTAEKAVIFLTDGIPTLPFSGSTSRNEAAVIRAAERAAAAGVRVYAFAIGARALERPLAAVEMARRTGGVFTPVRDPRHLSEAIQSLHFADFDTFRIRNVTLEAGADSLHLGPDGSWDALVPLTPGRNRLRVMVEVDGFESVEERIVHYAPGTANAFVPPVLETRRIRMRERKELQVHGGDDTAQSVRKTLELDRARVESQAARQLKELELDLGAW